MQRKRKRKNNNKKRRNKKKIVYNEWKEISPRQDILDEIGFDDYKEYMSSDLWCKKIRPNVKEKFKGVCQSCKLDMRGKNVRQIVHHREYTKANLDGDTIEGLTLVCETCHSKAHRYTTDEVTVIRSLKETNDWLDKPKAKTTVTKRKPKPTKQRRGGKQKQWGVCSAKGCRVRLKKNKLCKSCRNKNRASDSKNTKYRAHEKNKVEMSEETKEKLKRLRQEKLNEAVKVKKWIGKL